ncbi:MAG: cytochrome-c peroxidase [Bacteroidetes bacterium]|nr:MAG: cytochrome-c peroxidase [Bacteroidota bacterium]
MKNHLWGAILLALVVLAAACSPDENTDLDDRLSVALHAADPVNGKAGFKLPKSYDFASIPQDPRNALTGEKVTLGRLLYHETGLATNPKRPEGTGTYSCASCHFASAGFQAGRFQGIGEGGSGIGHNGQDRLRIDTYLPEELDVQPVRSPTTLNVAYQQVMLWNGQFGATGPNTGTEAQWTEGTPIATNHLGYEGVETQAIAGLNVHRLVINEAYLESLGYTNLFDAAFPEVPEATRYSREMAGLAIAAYERTLLANQTPFQRYLEGKPNAMNDAEKRGALLFFGEANCVSCHRGPALSTMTFYAFGMGDLDQCPEQTFGAGMDTPANLGRASFTHNDADKYAFKTPTLYNMKDSPFYGHGGTFRSISEVVNYKNGGVPQNDRVPASYLADQFRPLGLTAAEVNDITAFLTTALYDADLHRYEPAYLLSGQCFPNNDVQSSLDLGCN